MSLIEHTSGESPSRCILDSWQEIVGRLIALEKTDAELIVRLSSGAIAYPVESDIADYLRQELSGHEGSRVGVVRTNLQDRPILVRVES